MAPTNNDLKTQIMANEKRISELEKRTPAIDGKWFNFLRIALTALAIINTFFFSRRRWIRFGRYQKYDRFKDRS